MIRLTQHLCLLIWYVNKHNRFVYGVASISNNLLLVLFVCKIVGSA